MREVVCASKGIWQLGEKALTLNLLRRLSLCWAVFNTPRRTGQQLYSASPPWAL